MVARPCTHTRGVPSGAPLKQRCGHDGHTSSLSSRRPSPGGFFMPNSKRIPMATDTFGRALSLVLKHEGGYVDHARDPGGATNLGVTIGTLSAWLGRPATKAEVRSLTVPAVTPIYKQNYWDKVRADDLPPGVDYCVFDAAVNSGPSRASKWLQRAVLVPPDGIVGPKTLDAVKAIPPSTIINRICDDRLNFLRGLATWDTFGKGWASRVEGVRKEALAMAAAADHIPPPPDIEPIDTPAPSAAALAAMSAFVAALVAVAALLGIDSKTLKEMIR